MTKPPPPRQYPKLPPTKKLPTHPPSGKIPYKLMCWVSLVAQKVKNLPAMQEIQVRFLGWEDLLEKGMATNSSILAWKIPWTKEPGGLQFMGSKRAGHDCMFTNVHEKPDFFRLDHITELPCLLPCFRVRREKCLSPT